MRVQLDLENKRSGIAETLQRLQQQLAQTSDITSGRQNKHNGTAKNVCVLETHFPIQTLKFKKRSTLADSFSIKCWAARVDSFLQSIDGKPTLVVLRSSLSDPAHEWGTIYQSKRAGSKSRRKSSRDGFSLRFYTLSNTETARDKFVKWRKLNNLPGFSDDFSGITLKISDVSMEDKMNGSSPGLRYSIGKESCI